MKKILGVVLSVLFLTNIRGAAEGSFRNVENSATVQPGSEAASSADPIDRLSHLETITTGLLEVNQNLAIRVEELEAQNTTLTAQNTELHDRLHTAEEWIESEKRRQVSFAASLRLIPSTYRQHQQWKGAK